MQDLIAALPQWGGLFLQVLVAVVLGGIIGYQRELQDHPAGFRTHVLVCVGAAIYMIVSTTIAGDRFDPGRIAAQVATGIGFLGAGTIIKQGSIVRGLTTAASIWAVAGIGLAVGVGWDALAVAVIGTVMVFLALSFFMRIELRLQRVRTCYLSIVAEHPHAQIAHIRETLTEQGLDVHGFDIGAKSDGRGEIVVDCRYVAKDDLDRAINALAADKTIISVHWRYR